MNTEEIIQFTTNHGISELGYTNLASRTITELLFSLVNDNRAMIREHHREEFSAGIL